VTAGRSDYGDSVVGGFVVGESPLPFDAAIVIFKEYVVGKTKHNRQSSMKEWRKSTTTRASILVRMMLKNGETPATRMKIPLPLIRLAFAIAGNVKQTKEAPLLSIFSEFD
jgi:hypothetical protein